MTQRFSGAQWLAASTICVTFWSPARAQGGPAEQAKATQSAGELTEIIVTARRMEEPLQDVPISITVFNQEQLSNANITNTADLATYTPSLSANTRFGSDYSSFSIRGFGQELRTTPSVATYFADVVTPRGGPALSGGDGAGPGNLFDLQNVQVLNGPQGTLFGRNTTGGAILLVPRRPTDEFGGYLQVSAGDYGLRRVEAVLNLPLSDTARLRVGMDRHERDGYLYNRSDIGPEHFGDVNYEAYRVSFVADLAPNLENYTIATYTHALTTGTLPRVLGCTNHSLIPAFDGDAGTALFPSFAACSHQALSGGLPAPDEVNYNPEGFYDVWNTMQDPQVSNSQWQFINTTTWDVSDSLTIKNIVSYAELRNYTRADVFGVSMVRNPLAPPLQSDIPFSNVGLTRDFDTADQSTYMDELQFQGTGFGDRLTWQAGLYYEESDPQALVATISQSGGALCTNQPGNDPTLWSGCWSATGDYSGNVVSKNIGSLAFQTQAMYAQGTFSITDRLELTAGYRYTWDRTDGVSRISGFAYGQIPNPFYDPFDPLNPLNPPTLPTGGVGAERCTNGATTLPCELLLHARSDAPTWMIGLDYKLTDDDMVYAKYSRGYRQTSINIYAPIGFQIVGPEQVDSFEIGAKSGFDGPFPGVFNVSLFYNDLVDAQLQTAFLGAAGPLTVILNAPGVTTYGAEISSVVELFDGFRVSLAYSYLNTNVDRAPDATGLLTLVEYIDGQELYYMPEHKVTVGANYRLPLSESVGDFTLGMTYSYVDSSLTEIGGSFGNQPSTQNVNLHANWDRIFGGPIDCALFVTNATDEENLAFQSGNSNSLNFELGMPASPRMIGVRIRYNFGAEAN